MVVSDGVSEEPTGASVSACVMLPAVRGLVWCSIKELEQLGCRVVSLELTFGLSNIIHVTEIIKQNYSIVFSILLNGYRVV